MNVKKALLAIPVVLAMALTACSGGTSAQSSQSTGATEDTPKGTPVVVSGAEPPNLLIPADTVANTAVHLIDAMFSGLVSYDKDGNIHNEIAESVDTKDRINYTVKLKKGWKFSDGTDITSDSFINAWKLATTKQMLASSAFSIIEGTNDNGSGDLSGVKRVDKHTFTIKLKKPVGDFLQLLGCTPFYPLPESTIKDPKEGGEHPVTSGPYMPAGKDAWKHTSGFNMVPNPHYIGEHKPKNTGINFVFYTKALAAYRDLQSDQLDVHRLPISQLTTYKTDFPGRILERPSTDYGSVTIPEYVEHFSGEEGRLRRQAISYAIDRQTISEKIFQSVWVPAKEFSAPAIPGYNDHLKGNEVLTYDPKKAKELWEKADAIAPWSGTFTVSTNADGAYGIIQKAIVASVKAALEIDAEPNSYPTFNALLEAERGRKLPGAVIRGSEANYPSQMDYLTQFSKDSSGNYAAYSNPEFDKLLDQAQNSSTSEEFNKTLNRAQEILFQDLPALPMLNGKQIIAWSNNVASFDVLWNGELAYWSIAKK